jgi:hypothetical protein
MKEGKGVGLMISATCEKPIWDSRGSFLSAPSLHTIASIALTAISPPGIGAIGVGLIDDVLFGALDVAGGYKTWDEGLFEFGKAAAGSLVSFGVGKAFGTIGDTLSATSVLGKGFNTALVAGSKTFAGSVYSSAINAITYSSNSGLGFSVNTLTEGIKQGLISSAISATGGFVSGTLGAISSGVNNERLLGLNENNKFDSTKLINTIGNIAGQGVNFALTGRIDLNVFNTSDLGFENGTGLLEMHIGKKGLEMNFGTGGADVSVSTIAHSIEGGKIWHLNNQIDKRNDEMGIEDKYKYAIATALRDQYGFGDTNQVDKLNEILDGKSKLAIIKGDDERLQSITRDGEKTIYISEGAINNDNIFGMLRLGSLLGYEAYRDGVTDDNNDIELKNAAIGKIGMGDRINADPFYNNYYLNNMDFAIESVFYHDMVNNGTMDIFDRYLSNAYDNSADNYLIKLVTDKLYQNTGDHIANALLNASSKVDVDARNAASRDAAVAKFRLKYPDDERSDDDIINSFDDEKKKEFGLTHETYFNIGAYGCVMVSTLYMIRAITGKNIKVSEFNDEMAKKGLYINGSEISTAIMAQAINTFSDGRYTAIPIEQGKTKKIKDKDDNEIMLFSDDKLIEFNDSDSTYVMHLRISNLDYSHSVDVTSLDIDRSDPQNPKLLGFYIANPLQNGIIYLKNGSSRILRTDVFEIIDNKPNLPNSSVLATQKIQEAERYWQYRAQTAPPPPRYNPISNRPFFMGGANR